MLTDDANNGIADRSISRLVDNPSGPRYSPQLAALLHDYALDEDDDVTRKCFWLTEFLKFLACFPAHPLGKLVRDFNDSMGTRTMAGDEAVVDMVHEQQERIQANPHTLVGAMAQEMGVLPDPAEKKMKLADWYQSKLEAISGMSSIVNDKRFMTKFESRFKNSLLAIENETDIKSRDGSDTVAGTHMVTVQTLISQWGGVPPGADVSMGIHMSNIRKELTDDRPNFRQDGLYSDQGHNIEPNLWDLHAELTSLCYNGAKKRYEACLTKKQKKDRK